MVRGVENRVVLLTFTCLIACSTGGHGAPDATAETVDPATPECEPTTCEAEGAECGVMNDGCGTRIDCGVCGAPLLCGAGRCVEPTECVTDEMQWDEPGEYDFTVEDQVQVIRVAMWGAGGSGGNQDGATGGGGAAITGELSVVPGDRLKVYVGLGGQYDLTAGTAGDGGGASYVLRDTSIMMVAAGGGGGGNDGCTGCEPGRGSTGGRGGAGGGERGQDGANTASPILPYCEFATGGEGATQTHGGQGGVTAGTAASASQCNGQDGTRHMGGASWGWSACRPNDQDHAFWRGGRGQLNGGGGGGGSGYYGGGGAGFIHTYCSGGGGGGSSFADPEATQGVTLYDGDGPLEGHMAESSGAGRGGAISTSGASGRVSLKWCVLF